MASRLWITQRRRATDCAAPRSQVPSSCIAQRRGRGSHGDEVRKDAAEGVEGGARLAFLASGEATDGAIAAEGPYMRWPRVAEAEGAAAADLDDYARRVERQNGRAAMVGFALAVGVELVNGHSTVEQILDIFQAVGLIGVSS